MSEAPGDAGSAGEGALRASSEGLSGLRPGATVPLTGSVSTPPEGERSPSWVGRILAGRYELERVVGRGGMGIVYAARHVTVGRKVAIKVLRHDLAQSTEAVARFHREAQAAARIGNVHIVEVFDFGYSDDGDAFIVMELLEGEDLGCLVRREGPLPEGRCVAIARQIASALSAAHEKGIVHRDLKSENVFVLRREGQDFVKVLDFGISKVLEENAATTGVRGPTTAEGVVMGTPHYMAPEQALGALDIDHRIDLYALGCLVFEMLTGTLPFTGRNAVEVVFKHVHDAPPAPSKVRPGGAVSPALEGVVLRALSKDRDRRYASAADLAAALPQLLAEPGEELSWRSPPRPVERTETEPGPRVSRPGWRARVLVVAALTAGSLAAEAAWRVGLPAPGDTRAGPSLPREVGVTTAAVGGVLGRALPSGDASLVGVAVAPERDAGAASGEVTRVLTVIARPDGARIRVDGREVGAGDYVGRFAQASRHLVVVDAEGWVPWLASVTLAEDQTLRVRLQREPAGRSARAGRGSAADAGAQAPRGADPAVTRVPPGGLKQSPYGPR